MYGYGEDQMTPMKKVFHRSASFSASTNRAAAVPTPPPLSIIRPSLLLLHHSSSSSNPTDSAPDSNSSAGRRGQLAFFDRECSRIEEHLFLGSDIIARDRDVLKRNGITHILSCVGSPELFRPDLKYKTMWLSDTPAQDITSVLFDVFDYFEEVRTGGGGGRVLVHCSRGVSRSAALVVAYMMWRHRLHFDSALRRVRAARPVTDPNLGFASQLLSFQNRILSSPSSPIPTYRCCLYRIAPHSPYDPLHLVPKPLDRRPSSSDLDSRGAFIVRVILTVYVWIGTDCNQTMASSARDTASQFVKYEHNGGNIVNVDEGSEPTDFWKSLGKHPAQFQDLGQRRVDAYDLDFEIFHRIMRGKIVPSYLPPKVPGSSSPTSLPSRGVGWLRLKQSLTTRGVQDFVKCCNGPIQEDKELEPFGSPLSSISRDSKNSTISSDFFSSSPTSSTSDYSASPTTPRSSTSDYSASPSSELYYDGETLLSSSGQGKIDQRDSTCSNMAWSPQPDESEDWPFTPLRLAEEEDGDIRKELSSEAPPSTVYELKTKLSTNNGDENEMIEPALYKWPHTTKLENLHPGVLDSKSLFLLLAHEKSDYSKVLYVWVGTQSEHDTSFNHLQLQHLGQEFLVRIGISADNIHVQVVREEEEPEQFLNHFFTFHQAEEKIH